MAEKRSGNSHLPCTETQAAHRISVEGVREGIREVDKEGEFYTFRGYTLHDAQRRETLSASMEDYLEMVYRLSRDDGYTRVLELAGALHVQPPSASRMVRRLAQEGLVKYERYGIIRLTDAGRSIGESLLYRHDLLERFLHFIGLREVLEDAERIEHNISDAAVAGMALMLDFFTQSPESLALWEAFLHSHKEL